MCIWFIIINFVIQSKSKKQSNDGGKKDVPVYSCGDRGKYVYEFDFTYNDLENDFVDVAYHESTIKLMNRKIQNLSKNEDDAQDEVAIQKKIENYKAQLIEAEQKINSAENKISVKKIELGKKIIDDPEILKIVDAGNIKKNLLNPQPKQKDPGHGQPGHKHKG